MIDFQTKSVLTQNKILKVLKKMFSYMRKILIRKQFFRGFYIKKSRHCSPMFFSHPAKNRFPISTFSYWNTILRQQIAIHFRSVLPKRNWTPTVKNSHQYYSYSLIHNTYHSVYGYDLTIVLLRAQHLMMMICLKISTYKIRRNNDA